MRLKSADDPGVEARTTSKRVEPSRQEVLDQLERIVHSEHFRNSKRYPALLRFVVERTLDGHGDHLKERTLGVEVFGRPPDYDTNADPVVRFTAAEIRKRIAQYYQMPEHEHELRFELPLRSYVPHFVIANPLPVAGPAEDERTWKLPEPDPPSHDSVPPAFEPRTRDGTPLDQPVQNEPNSAEAGETRSRRLRNPLPPLRRYRRAAALFLAVAIVAVGVAGWSVQRSRRHEVGSSPFWQPVLAGTKPCLIVMGVHSLDLEGKDTSPASDVSTPDQPKSMLASMLRSEMVPVSDVISYGYLTNLLGRNNHTCNTRSASETAFSQLRTQPVILVGGFDNIWTMRLTAGLRFRFEPGGQPVHEIFDSQHPQTRWRFDSAQSALSNSEDYGIVSEFFDPQIEQHVIVVAGIGKDGTEAAAEFITDPGYLANWLATQSNKSHHNYEIVLSTQIIEGQHGPPHVIGSDSW